MATRRKKGRNRNRSGGWSRRSDGRLDVYVTVDTHEGPKYVRTTKKDEVQAEDWIEEVKRAAAELRRSPPPASFAGETVDERAERRLSDYRPTVRGVTYQTLAQATRNHVCGSPLAAVRVADLTAEDVRAWFRALPTGPASKNRALSCLKRLLSHAVEEGALAANPADGVRRARHRAKETPYLRPNQVWAYLDAFGGDPFEALFVVMATSGLRPSELLSLTWSDYEGASLLVDASVSYLGGDEHEPSPPKTEAGYRRAPLVDEAVAAMEGHRRASLEALVASGRSGGAFPDMLVFPAPEGGYYSRDALYSRWKAGIRKAGLPHVPLYALRHTASMFHAHAGTDIRAVEAAGKVGGVLGPRSHLPDASANASAK